MTNERQLLRRTVLGLVVGVGGAFAGCLGSGDDSDGGTDNTGTSDGGDDDESDAGGDGSSDADDAGTDGSDTDDQSTTSEPLPDGLGEQWPMFRGDRHNRGYLSGESEITDPQIRWEYTANGPFWGSPVTDGETVYIASYDEHIYAIDLASGELEWRFEMDERSDATPAVSEGVVVCGSFDQHIYGIDAETGDQLWSYDVGGIARSSPTIVDGIVYVGAHCQLTECAGFASDDDIGEVLALELATGDEVWTFETIAGAIPKPAVGEELVYVGSSNGMLSALERETGEERWNYETSEFIYSSPALVDGFVYVGDMSGTLYAVDAESGAEAWTYDSTSTHFTSSPAVTAESIYIGGIGLQEGRGGVLALDRNGEKRWIATVEAFEIGSSPLVVDNHIYIGSHHAGGDQYDGDTAHFYAFTPEGEQAWRVDIESGGVGSSPALTSGVLLFGSVTGKLIAIEQQ